jgi:energy-coupling factor transporter ATP-binding protein EcfA2
MELKFIWIEDYKNIKKTGFNFNHSIEEEFQFIDGEIIINPKLNNTPKNFFKDNITGVTAVIGKNGSGKTNLTEFINYNLAHATNGGLSTYINCKGICILDKNIFIQNEIKVKNEEYLNDLGYKLLRYQNAPLDEDIYDFSWHSMEKNKYIYYNPTFDLRGIPVRDNLVNISTTMLVYNDVYNDNKIYPYSIDDNSTVNQLNVFEKMEKSRICDFILNFKYCKEFIEFIPKAINISIDNIEINYFLKKSHYYGTDLDKPENKIINERQNEIDGLEDIILRYYDFEKYFVRQKENTAIRYYKIPIEEQKQIFFRLFFLKIFQILLNDGVAFQHDYFRRFIYNLELNELEDKELQKKLINLKNQVLAIIDLVEWQEFDFPIPDNYYGNPETKEGNIYKYLGSFEFLISDGQNKTILVEAITLMDEILKGRRMFSYEPLDELSSGQKHLLTLYSRFYWAKDKIKKSEKKYLGIKGDTVILFIDEGEVALHPEWQRVFLNNILKYFHLLFENYKIQLILTTHSPFVLSDLPKDNVIFLDRDKNGNSIISNMEIKNNTFGANIHDLLAEKFFLQEGLIGNFAKDKIAITLNWLKIKANELNSSKNNNSVNYNIDPDVEILKFDNINEEFKYHKQIIDLIGEPLVKSKLKNMFIEFAGEDVDFLKSELEKAKEKVIELEKKINP